MAMVYANPKRQDTAQSAVKEIMAIRNGATAISIMADLSTRDNYQRIIDETLNGLNTKEIHIIGMFAYLLLTFEDGFIFKKGNRQN